MSIARGGYLFITVEGGEKAEGGEKTTPTYKYILLRGEKKKKKTPNTDEENERARKWIVPS